MKTDHCKQSKALLSEIGRVSELQAENVLVSFEQSSRLLLIWVSVLRRSFLTSTADDLLCAVSSNIREAAALASLGLIRPTLFALRAQVDLLLSWAYFKDHPVEYSSLCRTGEGFVLKKEVIKYFGDNFPRYGERWGELSRVITRREVDVYRLLSAHVHSQSPFVIAEVRDLKDIVRSGRLLDDCCSLQADVAEYLSDILISIGILSEAELPASIADNLASRLKAPGPRKIIFG